MLERIQKILARAGLGSRRSCEEFISAGRVTVNGKIVTLGAKADVEHDKIEVDGRPVKPSEPLVYIALNKPRGYLSAVSDEEGRSTVLSLVPSDTRLYPVGRLDFDSEGLILLTNDGELAYQLSHPRFGHEKEYRVLVARHPDADQLDAWRRGIVLEDGYRTSSAQVHVEQLFGKGAWLRVIIHEGHKRQIREMGSLTGLPVVRIVRVRISSLLLGNLKPKEWRYLSTVEIESLQGKKVIVKPAARPRPALRTKPGPKAALRTKPGSKSALRTNPGPRTALRTKPGSTSAPRTKPGPKPKSLRKPLARKSPTRNLERKKK